MVVRKKSVISVYFRKNKIFQYYKMDPTVDYRQLHLEWIREHPHYRPKDTPTSVLSLYKTYFDEMYGCYYGKDAVFKTNECGYTLLRDDVKAFNKPKYEVTNKVNQMFGISSPITEPTFFITINFDEKKFNSLTVLQAVNKLFEKEWITKAYGVFEYHGKEDNHPHLHFQLQVNKYGKLGKIKDKLKATTLVTKFTGGINFVDIKLYQNYHTDYLALDKRPEKTEQLEKDIKWRETMGLPDFVEKVK